MRRYALPLAILIVFALCVGGVIATSLVMRPQTTIEQSGASLNCISLYEPVPGYENVRVGATLVCRGNGTWQYTSSQRYEVTVEDGCLVMRIPIDAAVWPWR